VNALRSPVTWGPAAGAAVIAAGGWDRKISDWAVENTPVFGSVDNAKKRSDDLRALSNFGMLGTAVAVPGGAHPWWSRIKRLLVEEAGAIAASSVTGLMKQSISRERPDESDNHSMPSGHSTRAFAYAAMSNRNLDAMEMSDPATITLKALFDTLAAGTAWARVEGERHYPTDVLVGASVGNFMALFIHDAFLGKEEKVSMGIQIDQGERSIQVRIRLP
jgi:membrane-associated phospholipid phosphatase